MDGDAYHTGQVAVQTRFGVREQALELTQMMRAFMPQQHRLFYESLPYAVVATLDSSGRPWASLLFGEPGFLQTPTATDLTCVTHVLANDPIVANMLAAVAADKAHESRNFGFLGIELDTRRRNRMNGKIAEASFSSGVLSFAVAVDETFGNCPKYIQTRRIVGALSPPAGATPSVASELTADMAAIVAEADTMFVATRFIHDGRSGPRSTSGLDVSHRGGAPGFVVALNGGKSIAWPDYKGNNMFMTLGNIEADARTGVFLPSFASGAGLYIVGRATILTGADAAAVLSTGTGRAVRLDVDEARLLPGAVPVRFELMERSPYNPVVHAGAAACGAEAELWATLSDTRRESPDVITFTFGLSRPVRYTPGQYASFSLETCEALKQIQEQYSDARLGNDDLIRTWTISSAPEFRAGAFAEANSIAITVRRDQQGFVSTVLHTVYARPPHARPPLRVRVLGIGGDFSPFCVDPFPGKILFLAGGIGITPFLSALRGLRARETPADVCLVWSIRSAADVPRALLEEARSVARVHLVLSREQRSDEAAHCGRLTADVIVAAAPDVAERAAFVCGPTGFISAAEDMLSTLGVPGDRVHKESFSY